MNRASQFLIMLTIAASSSMACDDATAPRAANGNLARFGVVGVIDGNDGTWVLLDADDRKLGSVEHTIENGGEALAVEFGPHDASLRWSEHGGGASCDGTEQSITACADGLTIAATILEEDGIDVPGFTASEDEDPGFRMACETVSTWTWGAGCGACLSAAREAASAGLVHDNGTCSPGAVWTSCTHTFCGGSELEMLEQ